MDLAEPKNISKEQRFEQPGPKSRLLTLEPKPEIERVHLCPIHKLTADELMLVFEMVNQDDWKAPLRISATCRHWRAIVRMAPKAWSNFYLPGRPPIFVIAIYMKRSNPYLLHLSTPAVKLPHTSRDLGYIGVIKASLARIMCLSIAVEELGMVKGIFVNLRRLQLTTYSTRARISDISRSQFPSLRSLHAQLFQPSSSANSQPVIAPPLIQQLTIATDTTQVWLRVLSNLHNTLVSLRINVREAVPRRSTFQPLFLPRLQYLQIGSDQFDVKWEFKAETPSLRSYIPARTCWATRKYFIEVDFSVVTHLRLEGMAPIAPYISLIHLQLTFPPVVIIEQLEIGPHLCPDLESIEYLAPRGQYEAIEQLQLSNWVLKRNIEGKIREVEVIRCTEYHAWKFKFPAQYPKECDPRMGCYRPRR